MNRERFNRGNKELSTGNFVSVQTVYRSSEGSHENRAPHLAPYLGGNIVDEEGNVIRAPDNQQIDQLIADDGL